MNGQALQKNGEYHILGRNSDSRENSGILELVMLDPVCNVCQKWHLGQF